MLIIPATDIIDGQCVRLTQGDYAQQRTYYKDPLDAAKNFEDHGFTRLHMVDLDGAKAAEPRNLRVLERVATHTGLSVQYGGGIKTADALRSVFNAGASRAIAGSIAAKQPEVMAEWLDTFGPERMILGSDVKDGKIAVHGWLDTVDLSVDDLIDHFMPALNQAIVTDISRDGMLCGPAIDLYKRLKAKYPTVDITVSGGISSMADIEACAEASLRCVIVGKAIYEGRVSLADLASI